MRVLEMKRVADVVDMEQMYEAMPNNIQRAWLLSHVSNVCLNPDLLNHLATLKTHEHH